MRQDTIDRIRKFSEDRDWDQFHSPANIAKSIAITFLWWKEFDRALF